MSIEAEGDYVKVPFKFIDLFAGLLFGVATAEEVDGARLRGVCRGVIRGASEIASVRLFVWRALSVSAEDAMW